MLLCTRRGNDDSCSNDPTQIGCLQDVGEVLRALGGDARVTHKPRRWFSPFASEVNVRLEMLGGGTETNYASLETSSSLNVSEPTQYMGYAWRHLKTVMQ